MDTNLVKTQKPDKKRFEAWIKKFFFKKYILSTNYKLFRSSNNVFGVAQANSYLLKTTTLDQLFWGAVKSVEKELKWDGRA